jgi:hypothetical protein
MGGYLGRVNSGPLGTINAGGGPLDGAAGGDGGEDRVCTLLPLGKGIGVDRGSCWSRWPGIGPISLCVLLLVLNDCT